MIDRLIFGMATLMREPSAKKRQEILDAVYAAGVRRFDVAPIYGLGRAEQDLGALTQRTSDCLVTTKFGRNISGSGAIAARVQAPARAILRHFPSLRKLTQRTSGGVVQPSVLDISSLKASIERSLERLGQDSVSSLLTHEIDWTPEWENIWPEVASLEVVRRVSNIGVSGPLHLLRAYPERFVREFSVLQYEAPTGLEFPTFRSSAQQNVYGVIKHHLHEWTESLGRRHATNELTIDTAGSRLPGLLLASTMEAHPDVRVVFSSSSERNATATIEAVKQFGSFEPDLKKKLMGRLPNHGIST